MIIGKLYRNFEGPVMRVRHMQPGGYIILCGIDWKPEIKDKHRELMLQAADNSPGQVFVWQGQALGSEMQ